jgi:hypothetical protein
MMNDINKIRLMKPNQTANQIRTEKFVLGRDSPSVFLNHISKKGSIVELRGQVEKSAISEQRSKRRLAYIVNGRELTVERDFEKEIPKECCENIKHCMKCSPSMETTMKVFIRIYEESVRDPKTGEQVWTQIPKVINILELGLCKTHKKIVERKMDGVSIAWIETRKQRMKDMKEVKARIEKFKRFANKLMRSSNIENSLPDSSFIKDLSAIQKSYCNTVWKTGRLDYKQLAIIGWKP